MDVIAWNWAIFQRICGKSLGQTDGKPNGKSSVYWLVVWNMKLMTFHMLGIVLTFIFFRGLKPPTSLWWVSQLSTSIFDFSLPVWLHESNKMIREGQHCLLRILFLLNAQNSFWFSAQLEGFHCFSFERLLLMDAFPNGNLTSKHQFEWFWIQVQLHLIIIFHIFPGFPIDFPILSPSSAGFFRSPPKTRWALTPCRWWRCVPPWWGRTALVATCEAMDRWSGSRGKRCTSMCPRRWRGERWWIYMDLWHLWWCFFVVIACYSDGQILRTSFGKKSENRHSGDVLSMGFKKSS